MLSLLHIGSTRVLDTAIVDERALYASERLDFHSFFEFRTVRDIQRVLRRQARDANAAQDRLGVVRDLLDAQQQSPHRLWTLLLLQAFEPELLRRRREISLEEDVALDNVLVETFIEAVTDIPEGVCVVHLRAYVLRVSREKLSDAMRGHWRGTVPLFAVALPSAAVANSDGTPAAARPTDFEENRR